MNNGEQYCCMILPDHLERCVENKPINIVVDEYSCRQRSTKHLKAPSTQKRYDLLGDDCHLAEELPNTRQVDQVGQENRFDLNVQISGISLTESPQRETCTSSGLGIGIPFPDSAVTSSNTEGDLRNVFSRK
jgi:hypothetical protein